MQLKSGAVVLTEHRRRCPQSTHECRSRGEVEGDVGVEDASERRPRAHGETSYRGHATLAALSGNQLGHDIDTVFAFVVEFGPANGRGRIGGVQRGRSAYGVQLLATNSLLPPADPQTKTPKNLKWLGVRRNCGQNLADSRRKAKAAGAGSAHRAPAGRTREPVDMVAGATIYHARIGAETRA